MEAGERWKDVRVSWGKPRIFIQQLLELEMPETVYRDLIRSLGVRARNPFSEDAAGRVVDRYLEDLGDDSQWDSVHVSREGGTVLLMTVVSIPYRQETYDRLLAQFLARKHVHPTR